MTTSLFKTDDIYTTIAETETSYQQYLDGSRHEYLCCLLRTHRRDRGEFGSHVNCFAGSRYRMYCYILGS
jgi:hypothetical protein